MGVIIIKNIVKQKTLYIGLAALVLGIAIAVFNSLVINPDVIAIGTLEKAFDSGDCRILKKEISKKQLEEFGYDSAEQALGFITPAIEGDVTLLQGYKTPVNSDNNSTIYIMYIYKEDKDYSLETDTVELYVDKGKDYLSIDNF